MLSNFEHSEKYSPRLHPRNQRNHCINLHIVFYLHLVASVFGDRNAHQLHSLGRSRFGYIITNIPLLETAAMPPNHSYPSTSKVKMMSKENKKSNEYAVDSIPTSDQEYSVPHSTPNHGDLSNLTTETRPWWRVPHFIKLNFAIFLITLTSTNNGFDGSLLNGLQSLEHWSPVMGHPTGHKLGALSNGAVFGVILSFPIAPWLSDRYGRVKSLCFGEFLAVVGSILQGCSTNYAFFLVSRIIVGFGVGLATVASPTLISEIAFVTHRPIATTAYNICWYLGATVAAIVTYLTRVIDNNASWRIPSYLQAFFPVVQLALFWCIPESPRYLIAKGQHEKAENFLKKYHIGNSEDPKDLEFVQFEMREIEAALETEKLHSQQSGYMDFIRIPSYRKRIFLIIFTAVIMQLSGNGLVSYYLNKVLNSIGFTDLTQQLQINMGLMIYNLVISAVVCSVVDRFRRRTMFLTCVSGMLVSYIIWTVLSAINQQRNFEDSALGKGVLAMIFFFYLFYNIGANGLPFLYATEILPYNVRTKGLNIFQIAQQVILVYNGFVNPIAMDAIDWKYYIVFCCILAVELTVVFFFYVETSGRTLEEVSEVFGDNIATRQDNLNFASKNHSVEHIENQV